MIRFKASLTKTQLRKCNEKMLNFEIESYKITVIEIEKKD